MRYPVRFHDAAEVELVEMYAYLAAAASPDQAWSVVSDIRAFCERLDLFPARGTERFDIMPSLRLVGF